MDNREGRFASVLIDQLGGTLAVARMFGISGPSVTGWKSDGLPSARLTHLKSLAPYRPDIAKAIQEAEATCEDLRPDIFGPAETKAAA